MRSLFVALFVLYAAVASAAEGPNGSYVKEPSAYAPFPFPAARVNPSVVTDANGYLVVTNNAQTLPVSPARPMSNTPMTTDSNSYLMVACSGCTPATTANLQIASLGLGTAASATTGTITSTAPLIIFPSTNTTSAVQFTKADGATAVLTLDTTNSKLILPSGGTIAPASGTFNLGSSNVTIGTTGIITSATDAGFANSFVVKGAGSGSAFGGSGTVIGWSNTASPTPGTPGTLDTAFARNAAGVVEVNNGTAGTFAQIKASAHQVVGANGQASIYQEATAQVTCNSGTGTCTFTNLIPAGSIVFGVDSRVTTTLTGASLTTWKLGDGTTTNAFANTQALTAGTTSDLTTHLSTWKPTLYTAATSVVMTANAGVFSTGVVRVTVHYISITAAGS